MSSPDPTSPTSPISPFPPLPPREYRSRAPEFYGFVAWTSTSLLFVMYLLWALLPDEYIHYLGVHWYPNREWSILVPAWTTVLVMTTYIIYSSMAIAATPSFYDMSTVTDLKAQIPSAESSNPFLESAYPNAIPKAYDIPLGLVNRVIYRNPGKFREGSHQSSSVVIM